MAGVCLCNRPPPPTPEEEAWSIRNEAIVEAVKKALPQGEELKSSELIDRLLPLLPGSKFDSLLNRLRLNFKALGLTRESRTLGPARHGWVWRRA